MPRNGRGLMVWVQRDTAGKDSVWGTTWTTATAALSTPALLETFTTDDIYEPSVAISPDGTRGVAVWDQFDTASNGELWANEWTMAGGFGTATRVLGALGVAEPVATIDPSYTITAAWTQGFSGDKWNVVAARKPMGQAWGATQNLETNDQAPGKT